MKNVMKNVMKKMIFGHKADSKTYIKYLREKGCSIGSGTVIFYPLNTRIDDTRPWLINIGNNVQITEYVTILTHGYDWSVIKGKYGEICGSSGKVVIGDNVFIGMKTTIMKGVTIGNNVIIGANSLVNKDVPDNVVVAGNPAKVIMTLDEYYKKRKEIQLDEAVECCIEYYKKYNCWPKEKDMREFIWLFGDRNNFEKNEVFCEIGNLVHNYQFTKEKFAVSEGKFDNFEKFIEYCKRNIE